MRIEAERESPRIVLEVLLMSSPQSQILFLLPHAQTQQAVAVLLVQLAE